MLYTCNQAKKSIENLKEYLQPKGWKVQKMDFKNTHVDWYAYKRLPEDVQHCNCNGRAPSLILYPWLLTFGTDNTWYSTSCEVELCATGTPDDPLDEFFQQDWVNLKYYSIKLEDIPNKLQKIEKSLTAAWEAVWLEEVKASKEK